MDDRPEDRAALTVRAGTAEDARFVVSLGATAFARFGRYAPIMRSFLSSPDVRSYVAWRGGTRVGFALVDAPAEDPAFADLVAIAVDAPHRRSGAGRALLSRVIAAREAESVPSILVLTVADDNEEALTLFRSFGFETIPGSVGRYAGGQTSHRMARRVRPRSADGGERRA